jgi:predicted Fe-Mo cluster-binding NifX family protein
MIIAVTSQGSDETSQVDPRFGRAAQFVLIDTETGEVRDCSNQQNLAAVQGAGIQAAKTVADQGAEVLLTGNVGPKAFATLKASGISVCVGVSGTVADAVCRYQAGEFTESAQANVEGHW